MFSLQFERLAPVVLRIGLALVFIWFGTHQLMDPSAWVGFLPSYTMNPVIAPRLLVVLNGLVEVLAALLLMLGLWLRPVGVLLALHLFLVAFHIQGDVGSRDFGLAMACLALAMMLPDEWALDSILKE